MKQNIMGAHNPQGFLTGQYADYIRYLEIDKKMLDGLFKEDEAYWRENLAKAGTYCNKI